MPEILSIPVRIGDVSVEGSLLLNEGVGEQGNDLCTIHLSLSEQVFSGEGSDFFDALISLRQTLESQGVVLLVYGASRNVWPSGMGRSMGVAMKAYRMTLGKQAKLKDLVGIFESGPDVVPSTIAEQERYRDEWFASLGNPA